MTRNIAGIDEYLPTMKLRRFVQVLLSPEVLGNKEEAQRRTGVTKQLFYNAMKRHPRFKKWFSDQCDAWLAEQEATVSGCLMRNISRGSDQALRTYYQLRGKLKNDALVDARQVHIGDKTETHITNIQDCRQVIIETSDKLTDEQKEKMVKVIMESARKEGLLPSKSERIEDAEGAIQEQGQE